jgi:hypothetical protein
MKRKSLRRVRWPIVALIVAALALIGAAVVIASHPAPRPVAATVNGAPIPLDALRERLAFEDFVQANQPVALPQGRPALVRAVLNRMIDEELVRQHAQAMGVTATQAEVEARLAAQFGQAGVDEIAARTADAAGLAPDRARALWLAQAENELLVEKLKTALNANQEGGAFTKLMDRWRAEADIAIDEDVLESLLARD